MNLINIFLNFNINMKYHFTNKTIAATFLFWYYWQDWGKPTTEWVCGCQMEIIGTEWRRFSLGLGFKFGSLIYKSRRRKLHDIVKVRSDGCRKLRKVSANAPCFLRWDTFCHAHLASTCHWLCFAITTVLSHVSLTSTAWMIIRDCRLKILFAYAYLASTWQSIIAHLLG